MKIVVTGKKGLLSSELQNIDLNIIGLSSNDYDITNPNIFDKLEKINPDIIIHTAAVTNSLKIVDDPILSINTNIIGTANIVKYCHKYNKRLVYISTDYIYPGSKGNYNESDPILPYNKYAWTKLGGECSVILLDNYLIIRTSFGDSNFPYEQAWGNQIVSKDYVDVIAPKILKASISNINGILNIGTNPKTIFEYASKRNNVKESFLNNKTNFSLNINKYEQLFSN